jgi:hypothetical protein
VVALVHALEVGRGRLDPELHLDRPAFEPPRALETHGLEDSEHLAVIREDFGDESLDPHCSGTLTELLQQPRPDASPLKRVGHHEGDLGRKRIAQADIARERDHPPSHLPD